MHIISDSNTHYKRLKQKHNCKVCDSIITLDSSICMRFSFNLDFSCSPSTDASRVYLFVTQTDFFHSTCDIYVALYTDLLYLMNNPTDPSPNNRTGFWDVCELPPQPQLTPRGRTCPWLPQQQRYISKKRWFNNSKKFGES